MEQAGTLDRQGALSLSAAINQTQVGTINMSSAIVLISYANYTVYGAGVNIDASLALEAISEIVLTNIMNRQGALTLQAAINAEYANTVIQNAVTNLAAQGNFTGAASMIYNGAILLQALAAQNQISNVDWNTLLTLSAAASEEMQSFMAGTAYDMTLNLAMTSAITTASNLDAVADTTLSAEAEITIALTDVFKWGIVELTAQGNIESASQLAAYGALLLQALAQADERSNQIFSNIPLVLNAIAQAVIQSDFEALQEVITGFTVPKRDMVINTEKRDFIIEVRPKP
jgi:hypothetical protein